MSKQNLDEFSEYWSKKMKRGQVSGFDRLEWMAIEIYDDWLDDRAKAEKRTKKAQERDKLISK
jgi:hypothetical protein